ncbi:hypothetical protein BDV29DRAFT_187044 [Aspergillus leporis]|uniref:Aminoglycoside phosphotransferase domain-containing protein n=1 Tax=Aspergillus leporis TaxID=41062 RepID=A0A5N5XG67_9EURO|nr:hypothetical protein BDV29DRAFT_187044 [Aspergillus leporis]
MCNHEISSSVTVELSVTGSKASATTVFQKLSTLEIPDLVPHVHEVGSSTMDNGKQVYSSIHTLITEAITLEGIWCKLEDDRVSHNGANRVCYLEASAHFNLLDKFHPQQANHPLGGPTLGLFSTGNDLVRGLVKSQDAFKQITITSTDEGGIQLESHDLQQTAVICHNDLVPRNILVRAEKQDDARYRYFHKDFLLGNSNLDYSWYRLFKDQMPRFLPLNSLVDAHKSLLKVLVQRKWIQREQLIRGSNISSGWIRNPEVDEVKRFPKNDYMQMESSVLKEWGYVA